LELQEELLGLTFDLEESLIAGCLEVLRVHSSRLGRSMLVVRAAKHEKGQQKLSHLGGKHASERPVHTGVIKSSFK
jgi:hypothetical protein